MPCEIERPNLTPRQRRNYHKQILLLAGRLVMRNRARKALAQSQEHQLVQVKVLEAQGQDHGPTQVEVLEVRSRQHQPRRRTERPAISAARPGTDPFSEWVKPQEQAARKPREV